MATIVASRTTAATHPSASRLLSRVQSVDLLRGIVMVIMALDHIRDFFHHDSQLFSPEDLTKTSAVLFFTRWMTHFCAPVFVFLAGTGSYLATRRGMSRASVSRFLVTRGLWLIIVEMTLVLFGGTFNLSYQFVVWQVIWVIGWSMIALSVLVYLPWPALLVFSLTMIAAHNAFDGVASSQLGSFDWLWKILHEGFSAVSLPGGGTALVIYPLIPWIGVMSAGYCFGCIFDLEPHRRRVLMLQMGLALSAAFVVFRLLNVYGDSSPWSTQPTALMTALSFLRTSKYPPSLLFLLMTLGPSLIALSALDRVRVTERHPLLVFGRVPLFYYVVHWYVLHLVAMGFAWMRYNRVDFLFALPPALSPSPSGYPQGYGYDLWVVYLVWAAILVALYPACRWFADVKARKRSPLLSYL
jgi:uncharacterized membrane protein